MNKKTIFKKLLQISLISVLSVQSACVIANNCYKVGYSQEVNGSFFDEKDSKGYFIYSYLDKKDSKAYFLYKIDLNGKAEKITDLGSRSYNPRNQNQNYLKYEFNILSNDKMLIQETLSNYNNNKQLISSSFYYYVDLKDKNLIYKKEALSTSSIFDSENKNLFNINTNGVDIFNIEKGSYYNNTITRTQNTAYLSPKWINSNTLMVIKSNGAGYKSEPELLSIYELKDNNINKVLEYNIKPSDANLFYNINPKNYANNTLEFEADIYESNENKKKPYYSKNLYNLNFSSDSIALIKHDLPDEVLKHGIPKIVLKASKQMYLENVNTTIANKKPIFDYLNELPKGFYSDEILCGDYKTMDKLSAFP